MIETPHIKCDKKDIAKTVLMPGDPLRAKFIAETYLKDYKLVNNVRGMLAYTGYYKDVKITVFASGMGMPSMGIYCYELYHFFNVENIIRIGSCGTNNPDIHVLDVILADNVYTEGNFAYAYNNSDCKIIGSSTSLNNIIINKAKEINTPLHVGNTVCAECFDAYVPESKFLERIPKNLNILGMEMEAFALFYTAKQLHKKASCLLTVSDSLVRKESISSEERQESFVYMIELALESGISL